MVRGAESILDQTDLPREYIVVGILRTPVANMTKITKYQTNPDIEGWGKLTLKEDDRRSRPADSTEFTPLLSS